MQGSAYLQPLCWSSVGSLLKPGVVPSAGNYWVRHCGFALHQGSCQTTKLELEGDRDKLSPPQPQAAVQTSLRSIHPPVHGHKMLPRAW